MADTGSRVALPGSLLLCTGLLIAAQWDRVLLDDEVGTGYLVHESYGHLVTHFGEWLTQPAFLVLAKLSSDLFSPADWALRLPSVVFALGGIVATFFLTRDWLGSRVAAVAAFLLAVHPFAVFHGQNARGYSMAMFLCTISMGAFLHILEPRGGSSRRGLTIGLYLLSSVLAAFTHLGSAGIFLAQGAMVAVAFLRRGGEQGRSVPWKPLGLLVGAGLLSILCHVHLLDDMLRFNESWAGSDRGGFSFGFIPLVLVAFCGGRGVSIYVFLAAHLAGIGVIARRAGALTVTCLLAWPAGIVLFYWVNDTSHYAWAYARFLLVALPALIVPVAAALVALSGLVTRGAVGGGRRVLALGTCVTLFCLVTCPKVLFVAFGERDTRWSDVIAELDETVESPRILYPVPIRFNSFLYYAEQAWGHPLTEIVSPAGAGAQLKEAARKRPQARLNPFVILVDLVPFDDAEWSDEYAISRHGPTTVLRPRREGLSSRDTALAVRRVTRHVIEFLESKDRSTINEDWVFWKIDLRQNLLFMAREELPKHLALMEKLEAGLYPGQDGAARDHTPNVGARKPGEVVASWGMLNVVYWDFLGWLGKIGQLLRQEQ